MNFLKGCRYKNVNVLQASFQACLYSIKLFDVSKSGIHRKVFSDATYLRWRSGTTGILSIKPDQVRSVTPFFEVTHR